MEVVPREGGGSTSSPMNVRGEWEGTVRPQPHRELLWGTKAMVL